MPKIDKNFLIIASLAFLILLISSIYYYHGSVQEDASISLLDFRVYYYAGFRLEIGTNIYDLNDGYFIYKYSPIFALIMSIIKFANVTPADALWVWYIILSLSFLVSLYLLKEILFKNNTTPRLKFLDIIGILYIVRYLILINFTHSYLPPYWPLFIKVYDTLLLYALTPICILSLLFGQKEKYDIKYLIIMGFSIVAILRFLTLNIDRGQINIIILMLLLFFVYYLYKGKNVLSGVYLGIAIIFKLVPVIFFIYLLAKRKIKTLLTSIVTVTTLLFIPSFRWGIRRNLDLLENWISALRATFPAEHIQHKNQSLMAAISRFFSTNSDISFIKLDDTSLTILIGVIYAIFIGFLVYILRRREAGQGSLKVLPVDMALCFAAMTILSPVGTKATFIYMIFPIAVLAKEAFNRNMEDKVINAGLLTYVVLIYLNSSDIIGNFSKTLHKYSLMTVALFIIFLLCAYKKISDKRID